MIHHKHLPSFRCPATAALRRKQQHSVDIAASTPPRMAARRLPHPGLRPVLGFCQKSSAYRLLDARDTRRTTDEDDLIDIVIGHISHLLRQGSSVRTN